MASSQILDLLFMEYSFLVLNNKVVDLVEDDIINKDDIVIQREEIEINNRGLVKKYSSRGGFTKLLIGKIIQEMDQELRNTNGIKYESLFYQKLEYDTVKDTYKVVWGWYPADFPVDTVPPELLYKKPINE